MSKQHHHRPPVVAITHKYEIVLRQLLAHQLAAERADVFRIFLIVGER